MQIKLHIVGKLTQNHAFITIAAMNPEHSPNGMGEAASA